LMGDGEGGVGVYVLKLARRRFWMEFDCMRKWASLILRVFSPT